MNSLLGQLEAISCAKKCFLLPSFRESIHKAIKFFSQFCYLVSVNLTYLHITPPNPYSKGGFVRVCLLVCLFVCLFFAFWNINTVLTSKHTISVTWNKTKITLQEVRKRGKLEEASMAYHREPHIISKLLRFVLIRI